MATNAMRCMLAAGAFVTLGGLASFPAAGATPNGAPALSDDASAPILLAQASTPQASGGGAIAAGGAYPAYQRGVREAASQGPEALRRYIWRTRMIYDYYYPDFVQD